jgi:hypothetical protein
MNITMRYNCHRDPRRIIFAAVLSLITGHLIHAAFTGDDDSRAKPDLSFKCIQNTEAFTLHARLSHWTGEREVTIIGTVIIFNHISGLDTVELDQVNADLNGEAEYVMIKDPGNPTESEEGFTFQAVFEGNLQYEPAVAEVNVRPLAMELDFMIEDSAKFILVKAHETGPEGIQVPLEETDVYFYAARSFSLLPVGDGWFEGGMAMADFPVSLPGDPGGNLTIHARIEDHELYGNVEVVKVKDWGLARPPVVVKKRRGLGDTDAPLWMVYTLIVLLSIVWFHYLYMFYIMFKIKKLESKQKVRNDKSIE